MFPKLWHSVAIEVLMAFEKKYGLDVWLKFPT